MKITIYLKQASFFALALALTIGISYAGATFGWTGPTQAPAGGNVAAPINVGSSTQTKNGSLILNAGIYGTAPNQWQNAIGLTVFGSSTLYGLTYIDGNQGFGKVLTSDANGNASWALASGAASSGSIGGGCFMNTTGMGGNYTLTSAIFTAWGNASTPYGSTAATTAQSATACTCPTGYTARISGQQMANNGASASVYDSVFLCVKN